MGSGFSDGVGQAMRLDGAVHYRVDPLGRRVGVLPATCKRGLHSLAKTGYSHALNDEQQTLRITCPVCMAEGHPDHTWRLTTTPPLPASAELDDGAYRGIEPQFQARPTTARYIEQQRQ